MPTSSHMLSLLGEAARILNLPPVVAYQNRAAWLVTFDDETMLDVEQDASGERVMFTGGIRDVTDLRRPDIYEMFLQYNYLWTETGGVRLALDGIPGQAVLMLEKPLHGLMVADVCRLLEKLAVMQRAWREILQAVAKPEDESGADVEVMLHELSAALEEQP